MANLNSGFSLYEGLADFYKILGVSTTASESEIKQRYRELSKIYHPDKITVEAEKEKHTKTYERIKLAYETLSNQETRKQYTKTLQNTFVDLKGEYLNGPTLLVQSQNPFESEQFNQEFVNSNHIDGILESKQSTEKPVKDSDLASYLALRDSLVIEPVKQQFPVQEIVCEAEHLSRTLQELIKEKSPPNDEITKNSLTEERDLLEFKSLLDQFNTISENITRNHLLIVDFIGACDKCNDLQLSYNSELVNQLKEQTNYERPEWSKIGNSSMGALAPFNDLEDTGMGVALYGSLLAPQIDQEVLDSANRPIFDY